MSTPQQRPYLVNAGRAAADHMPGWDQLQSVAAIHGGLQLAGLILLAGLVVLAVCAAIQLRSRQWPEWLDVGGYQLHSRLFETVCAAALIATVACEVAAYSYGRRQETLAAAAQRTSASRIDQLVAEAAIKTQPLSNSTVSNSTDLNSTVSNSTASNTINPYLKETTELRQKLSEAQARLADFETREADKRLSAPEKAALVAALRPYRGQRVSIASTSGDNDGQALAQDLVSVFDAAGWDHHGNDGVTTREWTRDPIGVEVALNENDARQSRIPRGVVALIDALRQLGLIYNNTVYMDSDVPAGQALVKVGGKLRQ